MVPVGFIREIVWTLVSSDMPDGRGGGGGG